MSNGRMKPQWIHAGVVNVNRQMLPGDNYLNDQELNNIYNNISPSLCQSETGLFGGPCLKQPIRHTSGVVGRYKARSEQKLPAFHSHTRRLLHVRTQEFA